MALMPLPRGHGTNCLLPVCGVVCVFQGRVLYDIILYKTSESGYLLECDNRAVDEVVRHLKKYALRSKVQCSKPRSNLP